MPLSVLRMPLSVQRSPGPAGVLSMNVVAQYLREKLHKSFADALGDQAHVNRAAPRGRRSRVCVKAAIRDAFKTTDEQICSREREILGCGEKRENGASCAVSGGVHFESSGAAAVAGVIYGQVSCVVEREGWKGGGRSGRWVFVRRLCRMGYRPELLFAIASRGLVSVCALPDWLVGLRCGGCACGPSAGR